MQIGSVLSVAVPTVVLVSTTFDRPDLVNAPVLVDGGTDGSDEPDLSAEMDELDAALDDFATVLDRLHALDLTAYTDVRVEDGLRRYVAQCRRAPTVRHAFVAEVIDRCLPVARRCSSTAAYLRNLIRISAGEGRAWERDAHDLAPRRALSTGEVLPARRPAVAAAVREGAIGTSHARAITDTLRQVPAAVSADEKVRAEVKLVRYARRHDPNTLARRCAEVLDELDPDGSLGSTPEHRDRVRTFQISAQNRHGMFPVKGLLSPEVGAMLTAALSPLAAPQPGPDGSADPRRVEQRDHDALGELARRALAAGDLPVRHGFAATVLYTATIDQIEARTGEVSTAHGGRVPVRDLLRLAAETRVIPLVFDSDGQVLHFGEEQRLATGSQRHALYLLDGGCTFEGCAIPATWCQSAHGAEGFQTTRRTTIDDLALLCGFHHRLVDTEGWFIERINGRVWITPPKWIDPDQVPRTNERFRPLQE